MLFTIVGIAIVAVAICLLLKSSNPEFSLMTALIAGVLILGLVVVNLMPVFDTLSGYANQMNLDNSYFIAVIKALGICYITQLAADTCHDAGYGGIASKVELAGKVSIIIISLPLFENLIEIAANLLTMGG